ncbi:MAG: hypothetical protein V2J55_10150 [Candidatus Competibacteraceae bacterium]|jgi:hypothetical protein|nr:hypothetical protein [Candidatus Competibacteraceae bacterium]
MDFNHPVVQSVLLPLILGFVLTGALRLLLGRYWGARVACVSISLSLLLVVLLLLGLTWPANTAVHKLPYLLTGSVILGLLVDWQAQQRSLKIAAMLLWPLLVLGWLAAVRLRNPELSLIVELAALSCASVLIFWRLERVRADVLIPSSMVLSAAIGLGAVAALSASLSLGQLAFALAAAVGGFMLWNWPKRRDEFAYSGIFGAAGALLILTALVLLLTDARPIALAVLGLIFCADWVSNKLPPVEGKLGSALKPIYLIGVAAIPIALAVVLTIYAPQEESPYYSSGEQKIVVRFG